MRCVTILACLCLLPVSAGLAKAAIAPATSGEVIAEEAFVVPGEMPGRPPQPEPEPAPVPPPAATTLAPSSEPAPTSANPLWAIPLSALSATRERPLFSASRRPPPPAVAPVAIMRPQEAPPPPPEPERPSLALVGTVIGGPESFGIFIDQTNRTALRLRLGQQHDGWTLRSVQKREATLEKDEQSVVVAMPQPGTAADGENEALPPNPERDIAEPSPPPRRRR